MRTKVAPGLMRAPQSPGLVGTYLAGRFIKADSPNATIELDWAWGLAPETELGRRFKPLMPKEWAEYVVAKRTDRIAKAHGVVTNSTYETLTWQGLPGYKVTIDYTTVLGLDSRIVTYGAVYKEDMYSSRCEPTWSRTTTACCPSSSTWRRTSRSTSRAEAS